MARALAFAVSLFSDGNLTKKAYLNSLAAGLIFATRFAVAFLVTPFLVAGLGDVLYGVWAIIIKMTDLLSAGGRSAHALKWFVVNRQESNDAAEKRRGVGGAIFAWVVFLPLQLVLGGLVAWYLPFWIDVDPEMFSVVRMATALVVAILILRGVVDAPELVLIGENLSYKRAWLSATLAVVGGVLTILALHWGLGIVGVAAAMVLTTIITGLAFLVAVRFYVPWFGVALPDRQTMRQFVGWSWWFSLSDLTTRLMDASDVILLGIIASPEVVTVYALVRYLPEGVLRFITNLVYETVPGVGKIFAGGDLVRTAQMRGEVLLLTWLATTAMGATMIFWNDDFVRLWVSAKYIVDSATLFLIVLMIFQYSWIRADSDFINLTLDLRKKVALAALSSILSIVLAIGFMRWLDGPIAGVCLGFICGRLILSIGYPAILGQVLKAPLISNLPALIRPALVTICLFVVVASLSDVVNVNTWLALVTVIPVTLALTLPLAFFTGLSAVRRNIVQNRFRVLITGKGRD